MPLDINALIKIGGKKYPIEVDFISDNIFSYDEFIGGMDRMEDDDEEDWIDGEEPYWTIHISDLSKKVNKFSFEMTNIPIQLRNN